VFHDALIAFRQLTQPVLAVVHGAVAGGGLSLALGCDFIIAEEKTKFATAYRKLGAATDGGMTHSLSRILGQRKALELLLMGEIFLAPQALELGLINRVVSEANLEADVAAFCDVLARNAPAANGCIKRLVYEAPTATFEEQLSREMRGFSEIAATDDFKEGVTAFIERRIPAFAK
jgi:2-(1,2-epoxy-1,2-dihydrophenyl)acetyl-CoA isomerase